MDLFVVPTISFQLLYGLLILRHDRRRVLWMGVTAHPTAEWVARQLTEACGWDQAPTYLLRDRDQVYGQPFTRRLRAMGIHDRPTSPRSPWQNAYAERLIGAIRRECVDHIVVFGEQHLRHALLSVHELLQRTANTSVVRQGCSGITCSSCRWPDSSEADPRRATTSTSGSDLRHGHLSAHRTSVFIDALLRAKEPQDAVYDL
jgi:hypothetical protein